MFSRRKADTPVRPDTVRQGPQSPLLCNLLTARVKLDLAMEVWGSDLVRDLASYYGRNAKPSIHASRGRVR
jgi:hypothetical protein